jgi:hypothetical protein
MFFSQAHEKLFIFFGCGKPMVNYLPKKKERKKKKENQWLFQPISLLLLLIKLVHKMSFTQQWMSRPTMVQGVHGHPQFKFRTWVLPKPLSYKGFEVQEDHMTWF